MAKSWCKVASNLDSHPKIRRAGRNGREVFLFALRRNAEPGNPVPGRLPAAMLEPWYLADQLMMSESEAVTGVTAAVTAGLLVQDGESWAIDGWDEDWGKTTKDGAERTAKWRKKNEKPKRVTKRDKRDVTECHGDACDALEEKRREEKREESLPAEPAPSSASEQPELQLQSPEPKQPPVMKQAIAAWAAYFSETHSGSKPSVTGKAVGQIQGLLDKHGLDEFIRRLAYLRKPNKPKDFWPPTPWGLDSFVVHFDRCAPPTASAASGHRQIQDLNTKRSA